MRELFLRALAENEDDTTARLIYSDWLEEHDEYEEADRQRQWPAARRWLLNLCPPSSDPDADWDSISYQDVLAFGERIVEETTFTDIYLGDDAMRIWDAIGGNVDEFLENWSIVTGIPLPAGLEKKSYHWRCCSHEEYLLREASPTRDEGEKHDPRQEPDEWDEWDAVQDELANVRRRNP